MTYLLCFFAGCCGWFLNIVCGFGAGIFSMMFLPYVMGSTGYAATLVNILSFFQGIAVCWLYRKKVCWRQMLLPFASYLLISTVTVYFSKSFNNDTMKILLALLLLVLSVYFLVLKKRLRMKATPVNALSAGAVGGVMSALFSIGGPPMSLYYSAVFDDKEQYLATIQSYFSLTNAYILILRFKTGLITQNVLQCSAVAFVGMLIGSWCGKKVFDKIDAESVRKLIYIMMAFSGIIMLTETIAF